MASSSDLLGEYKGDVDFDFFETPREDETPKQSTVVKKSDKPPSKQNGRRYSGSDSETDSRSESDRENNSHRSAGNRSDVSSVLTIEARIPTVEMRESLEAGSESEDDSPGRKKSSVSSKSRSVTSAKSKNNNAWSNIKESSSNRNVSFNDKSDNVMKRKPKDNGVERKKRNRQKYSSDESSSDTESSGSSRSRSSTVTDSRSETDSDVTEVSPLASPDLSPAGSPRRKMRDKFSLGVSHDNKLKSSLRKSNLNSSQNMGSGDAPATAEFPRGNDACVDGANNGDDYYDDNDLDRDRINLKLLMQAVLEMDKDLKERQERLKTNRRVMGPPQQSRQPQAHSRKNLSFTNDKTKEIDRENERLLQKILTESSLTKDGKKKKKKPSLQPPSVKRATNATINRQRQQRVIEQENLAMLKRLESIRPTKGMSRNEHLTEFHKQQTYGVPLHGASSGRKSRTPSAYGSALSSKCSSMTSLRSTSSINSVGSQKRSTRHKGTTDPKSTFEPGIGRWSFKPESYHSDDDL